MPTEADVRRLATALPEVTEKPSYGTPGFRVKDKLFLRIRSDEEGYLAAWVADLDEKDALLGSDPAVFHTTAHYDGHPMVLVDLEAVELDELAEVITESWRVRAPAKVRKDHPDVAPDPG